VPGGEGGVIYSLFPIYSFFPDGLLSDFLSPPPLPCTPDRLATLLQGLDRVGLAKFEQVEIIRAATAYSHAMHRVGEAACTQCS
jgi:hypothetical protein